MVDRPNPYDLNGALVGGPAANDTFIDNRDLYQYTEVALDYNAGLTLGCATMATFPADFWSTDCTNLVPNYNWEAAQQQYTGNK